MTLYNATELNTAAKQLAELAGQGFSDWKSLGRISANASNDLVLLNYTQKAQYEGNFSPVESVCRGLVLSNKGEIVARPFDKFYNWGERGLFPARNSHMTYVTEKMDGSLLIGFMHNGLFYITTRGTFDSPQALLGIHLFVDQCDISNVPDNRTLLMELIHPNNRIVVDYGDQKALYLLAIRNNLTGEYVPRFPTLYEYADAINLEIPLYDSFNNPGEIIEATGKLHNAEGWVAEFSDGSRWKFKGDEYREISRILPGITTKRTARLMHDVMYDSVYNRLPAFLQKELNIYRGIVEVVLKSRFDEINKVWNEQTSLTDRKAFALAIKDLRIAPYLFARYDGHSDWEISQMILEKEF